MIELITGLPRNGKSLYTLATIKARADKENRLVFYYGIKGITYDGWIELLDPTKWYECPESSIILIDECQRIFRNRASSAAVPKYVEELETHGHHGFDLYLITQKTRLVDINLRSLVNNHHHVVRIYGKEEANIYSWIGCKDTPDSSSAKADGIKSKFNYPKEFYAAYQSSVDHNVSVATPLRYHMLKVIPVIFLILIGYAGYHMYENSQGKSAETIINEIPAFQPDTSNIQANQFQNLNYAQLHTPQIPDFPETAPIYENLNKPVLVPINAACIQSKTKGCKCYTQQATPLSTSASTCKQIVKHGYFNYLAMASISQQPQTTYQPTQLPDHPSEDSPRLATIDTKLQPLQ